MLRSFFWFSFLLLLSATVIFSCNPTTDCGCSKELLNLPKIIGGQPVRPHSFPWVVSIRVQNYHICTGSIVTKSFIITAAHCTSTLSVLSDVTVVAGTNLLTEIGQTRSILQIHQHPNFDLTTMTNDIAILHLSSPFNFNDSNVSSICLPAIYDKPIGGMNLVTIGWGTTDENVLQASNELRQVTIQAFDSNAPECIPVLRDSTVQFCAGVSSGGQGVCYGDSGGPLMEFNYNQWLLMGISSASHECAQPGLASIFTRVSVFNEYIQSIINSK